jgi:hypothetical protein
LVSGRTEVFAQQVRFCLLALGIAQCTVIHQDFDNITQIIASDEASAESPSWRRAPDGCELASLLEHLLALDKQLLQSSILNGGGEGVVTGSKR